MDYSIKSFVENLDRLQNGRIKKGVRPYGGRRVYILGEHTYPNGRKVVELVLASNATHGFQARTLEYEEHEVERLGKGEDR